MADVFVNDTRIGKTTTFWKALSSATFDTNLKIGLFSGEVDDNGELSVCARCGDEYYTALRHFDKTKRFCPFCAGFGKLQAIELEELSTSPPWPGEDPRSW